MEWVKVVGPLIFSWPVMALVAVLIFRRPLLALLNRFGSGHGSEAELGPLKIKLGVLAQEGQSAVGRLNRITELMAETRLLELEITSGNFGPMFTAEQRARMEGQIQELRQLTANAAQPSVPPDDPAAASRQQGRG